MKIIVQKFGKTSISTIQRREMACDKVITAINKGYSPIVVVSTNGTSCNPYTTDTLLSLTNKYLDKKSFDKLLSRGKSISEEVLLEGFEKRGIKTKVFTGGEAGIITDSNYNNTEILKVETEAVKEAIDQGFVPIVVGFQGRNEKFETTTLGRGASDVTACALGDAFHAEFVEIYSDVDGIMTADPRIVKEARLIEKITYDSAFVLAMQDDKIIYPKAISYAMAKEIPVYIKNIFTSSVGTLITSNVDDKNVFTSIKYTSSKTQISITCDKKSEKLDLILDLLAENKINADLISVAPESKLLTVDDKNLSSTIKLLRKNKYKFNVTNKCSKISLISNKFKDLTEVILKIFKTLNIFNIEVIQASASNDSVFCLVQQKDYNRAMNVLHNEF